MHNKVPVSHRDLVFGLPGLYLDGTGIVLLPPGFVGAEPDLEDSAFEEFYLRPVTDEFLVILAENRDVGLRLQAVFPLDVHILAAHPQDPRIHRSALRIREGPERLRRGVESLVTDTLLVGAPPDLE